MLSLKSIQIENFRSLKDCSLNLVESKEKCHIMVGLNESGKSNFLLALKYFLKDKKIDYDECISKGNEGSDIKLVMNYEVDFKSFKEELKSMEENERYPDKLISQLTSNGKKSKNNSEKLFLTYSYIKNEKDKIKGFYSLNDLLNLSLDDFYVIKKEGKFIILPDNRSQSNDSSSEEVLEQNSEESSQNKEPIKVNDLEEQDREELNGQIKKTCLDVLESSEGFIKKTVFWKYEDNYILPNRITLQDFLNSGENSNVPFRNILRLIEENLSEKEITDIVRKIIEDQKGDYIAKVKNFMQDELNKFIKSCWKGSKVKLEILLDNTSFALFIQDTDYQTEFFQASARSDGFKHFLSMILTLFAENKSQSLKNHLILIDEPETHLHPLSIVELKRQILNISKNNIVFFSTHSPFMIDTSSPNRHYQITKNKGLTNIEKIDEWVADEVIFKALGVNLFFLVKPYAVIVEGSIDRHVLNEFKTRGKGKKTLKEYQIFPGNGAPSVLNKITLFSNYRFKKIIVLLDSDQEGNRCKDIIKKEKFDNVEIVSVEDILENKKTHPTLEDLYSDESVESVLEEFGLSDEDIEKILDAKKEKGVLESVPYHSFKKSNLKLKLKEKVIENRKNETGIKKLVKKIEDSLFNK